MGTTAYDALYLSDTNLLHEDLFGTVAKRNVDFGTFVKDYLKSNCRKGIDRGNARYMNMTTDEYMSYLFQEIELKAGITDIDYLEASWIGIVYNMVQFYSNLSSEKIFELIDYARMKQLFLPLHTVDYEVAATKIVTAYGLA